MNSAKIGASYAQHETHGEIASSFSKASFDKYTCVRWSSLIGQHDVKMTDLQIQNGPRACHQWLKLWNLRVVFSGANHMFVYLCLPKVL